MQQTYTLVTGLTECDPPSMAQGIVVYFAGAGETLYDVAKRFAIPRSALRAALGDAKEQLEEGQRLVFLRDPAGSNLPKNSARRFFRPLRNREPGSAWPGGGAAAGRFAPRKGRTGPKAPHAPFLFGSPGGPEAPLAPNAAAPPRAGQTFGGSGNRGVGSGMCAILYNKKKPSEEERYEAENQRGNGPKYQWDLSHIFENNAAWEAALEAALQAVEGISAYRGTLGSIQGAKAALDAYYALAEQAERIYLYAELTKAGDNGDQAAQAMQDRAMGLLVNLGAAASFLTPELAALPMETLEEYAKAEALSDYRHGLQDIIRGRAYVLSPEQEHMLALLADPAQTPDNAFSMLSEVDMALPSIQDETGETVQLTHGNYGVYRESKDRGVRQRAFEAYFGAFNGYINTFAALYGGSVKLDCYFAKCGACQRPEPPCSQQRVHGGVR